MTEQRNRRILWPIVAASLTLPTTGAGVYYAVMRPGSPSMAENSQTEQESSLDVVEKALADTDASTPSVEPLALPVDQSSDLPVEPLGTNRYGSIQPVQVEQPYVAPPVESPEVPIPPTEMPIEAEVSRGQSPGDESSTVQPLENSLRGNGRYGSVPQLPEPPPAMAEASVNSLRGNAEPVSSSVEPPAAPPEMNDTASAIPNPFARASSEAASELPPDPSELKEGFDSSPLQTTESPTPAPTTRSVLVSRDNATASSANGVLSPTQPPTSQPYSSDESMVPINAGHADGIGGTDGDGKPGERALDGPQHSGLLIQKFAPPEIQIGKPCKFTVKVRNASEKLVADVEIRDQVPQGTRLINTTPTAENVGAGVVWKIGTLSPGEERTVEMQVEPTTEGEIGSVATVSCAARASVRTVCTRPQLTIKLTAPPKVLVGRQQRVQIELHNPGTGDASGVVLLENVPDNLSHVAGSSLEFAIGTLRAGETRQLELILTAEEPGPAVNRMIARGDGNLQADEAVQFEVVAPALEVAVEGPRRRFLDRPATYLVNVNNPGTAAARDVQLVTKLPRGMRFVQANNLGEYDAATHSIHWSLAELPEGENGTVELVAMPVEAGQHALEVEGRASEGLEARHRQEVQIEGLAAIDFEVLDHEDPIEVGGETTYEIRVSNQGTKAATNVQIAASLPQGMNLLSANGETSHRVQAGNVVFDPIASLAPKADTIYRLQVQVSQPGDLRLGVEIQTDDLQQPIRKEESTRVFGDE